jgi:hypothetical protein
LLTAQKGTKEPGGNKLEIPDTLKPTYKMIMMLASDVSAPLFHKKPPNICFSVLKTFQFRFESDHKQLEYEKFDYTCIWITSLLMALF